MLRKAFLKFNDGLLAVERSLLIGLNAVIAIFITVGVAYRYLLNDPLVWVEEFLVGLFVWLAFVGASYAASTSDHIQVSALNFLYDKFKVLYLIPVLITMAIVGVVFVNSIDYVLGELATTSASLNVSRGWFASAVPVGMLGMLIHMLALLVRNGPEHILYDPVKTQLIDEQE